LRQRSGLFRIHVQQDRAVIRGEKEIGKIFALRRQDRRIDKSLCGRPDIIGDQPLKEIFPVISTDPEHPALRSHFRSSLFDPSHI